MRIRIHWEYASGIEDSMELEGTLEELQVAARDEVAKRGGQNPWSEVLEEA